VINIKKTYYENGQPESETPYKDSKVHGKITFWYDNGNKEIESHWVNGVIHGLRTTWREDGTLESQDYYFQGKEVTKEEFEKTKLN